ncbi:MAG: diadenylate cyclase CdaA [candidate division Zixibacteria bacterium]|nr:diadenylate cyclase CdaA [candidate division Zixibacteria bacterium]
MELFHVGFIKFGIVDLIDVAIVWFLFYRLLILMKGTRSVQIVIGLFLVILVSFIAFWFQLEGLKWLISNIATVGIIVLVIVFQPELRGALAQIGHNKFIRMFFRYEKEKTLDDVVRGTIKLAELRYGALIVLERDIGLKDFAETGKELNAQVSSELLVTLFTPYTPLHDGAAIISGEKVVAVACTLPLSQNPQYINLYGMRHRAAVGITEESDAVVVAVSEETGNISVAFGGRLQKNIDKSVLKDMLLGLMRES